MKTDNSRSHGHHPDLISGRSTPKKLKVNPDWVEQGKKQMLKKISDRLEQRREEFREATRAGLATTAGIQETTRILSERLLDRTPPGSPQHESPPTTPVMSPHKFAPSTPPVFKLGIFSRTSSPEPVKKPGGEESDEGSVRSLSLGHGSVESEWELSDGEGEDADEDDPLEEKELEPEEEKVAEAGGQAPFPLQPLDVYLPTRPMMRYRPTPAPVYDSGNGPLFHQKFLHKAGPTTKVGLTGGYMIIRPKSIEIVVNRVSFATRTELINFVHGRFPLGGVINKQAYSNAVLPLQALRHLPGKVTITY